MVVNLNVVHVLPVYDRENIYFSLFSIFLNDLEDFFKQLDGEPLKIIQEKLENELHIFYNFFVNVAKTKVMIFIKGKLHKILILLYMVKRLILLIHTHIFGYYLNITVHF
jgi:hypothetical protein